MSLDTQIDVKDFFYKNLVSQIRSVDTYGAYSKYNDDELIELKFINVPEKPDKTGTNIKYYLQAACLTVEKLEGNIVGLMGEASCDGSVQGLFYSGQLILMEKTFGSQEGFYFASKDKLQGSGAKLVERLRTRLGGLKETYKELVG